MKKMHKSVEVDVPVRTAYNQWTQFEEFPQFMKGVQEVRQTDDTHLSWRANVGGKSESWTAEITEQKPDQSIAWTSQSGAKHAGRVSFEPVGANKCRVDLEMSYEPEGMTEKLGDAIGVTDSRVKGDLERFKKFIETRGQESGAWRGEVN